ncbi:DoxX family protein [Streptoalloteichus hindustanus]|uniref:Putative oxidoreductase n=1 Tax=Streptoalloteichus hindustanus TaxID=2017 RepID=A0A1M5LSY1_STRHI|nr:DoxX family protein [Streptoalloteichus hindustanus]SHG68105.1 putative oxidoreductase [Streptoalloteichus hindustanus]
MTTLDLGLLVLRVVVGLLLVGHGAQKLFGAFGGHGLAGTGGWLESQGFRPGRVMALLAGLGEVAGGAGLALGLLTPLAGAAVIGTMVVAATTHAANGLWVTQSGYEYALVLAVTGAGLALTGPGSVSVDALLGIDRPALGWALAAVALGLVSGLAVGGRAAAVRRAGANAA